LRTIFLLVALSLIGTSCTRGTLAPQTRARGTLKLSSEAVGGKTDIPFSVVVAAPQGSAPSVAEISIVFSRSLRGLEMADAAPPPIRITPAIAGTWIWVGARALRFVSQAPTLPPATAYTVEVPAGTRSVDGSALAQPFRFAFETPRPAIVSSSPGNGERDLDITTALTLEWNQPVDPARLTASAVLSAAKAGEKPRPIPFVAERPNPQYAKKVVIRAKTPLPKNSEIGFQVPETFVGQGGPLPSGTVQTISFRTYEPLSVTSLACYRETPHRDCAHFAPVELVLSTPVRLSEARRALHVTPPLAKRAGTDESEFTTVLDLGTGVQAGTTYTVTLDGSLRDKYGQSLGQAVTRSIRIDDYFPRAEIGASGDTFTAAGVSPLPIKSVNLPGFEIATAVIRPEDIADLPDLYGVPEPATAIKKLRGVQIRKVAPRAEKNQSARELIDPREILGARHGAFALGISYGADRRDETPGQRARIIKVTDLGVSAKLSPHGSLIWVTRLDSIEPVPSALVQIVRKGERTREYTTDSSGVVQIPASDFRPEPYPDSSKPTPYLVVRKDDDFTFASLWDYLSPARTGMWADLSGAQAVYGMIFTERGVYRPGEIVRVKGILRRETPSGNAAPRGESIELILRNPEGEQLSSSHLTLTEFGTFAAELRAPETGSLGQYTIYANTKPDSGAFGYFQVAEYRPAEFKSTVESNQPAYRRGESSRWTVRGDYLFGAPMAGASVHYTVTRARASYPVPGADGWATEPSTYYADLEESPLSSAEMATRDGKLDASGALSFVQPLELADQVGPEVVRVDAEVTDVSRQSTASGASAMVHPADYYVGIKLPENYFFPAPGEIEPEVAAWTPQGKRLAGKPVHLELIERRWTLAREQRGDGESRAISKVVDRVVGACDTVTSTAAPASCRLHAERGGYYLAVASSVDGGGRKTGAAIGSYGIGASGGGFGDNDRGSVQLVPDKKSYKVGESANVLVKSPFASAEALVTVERAGIYYQKRVPLAGPTPTVAVPITANLRPNAFVSVHLLRKGTSDTGGIPFRIGYAELPIEPESRRLVLQVKPNRSEYRPGDEVSIDLLAKDNAGKPARAELAVYAVDEGVLLLTGYRTPDPVAVFTESRPLQVATLETRARLAKIHDLTGDLTLDKGDDGGGGGDGTRADFRTTAYFNPSVLTDAKGRAKVSFRLPDGLTTYRVMAVAATSGDQYGFGAASIVAAKKIMARPNLPRLLRAGDAFEASVILSAKGIKPGKASVRLAVTGATASGPRSREVDMPPSGSVEVRFPLRAEKPGVIGMRFEAVSGSERDAVEVTRKVVAPGALETVALYGSTEDVSAEKLGDFSLARRDVGELIVTLASSALVGIEQSALDLTQYPYACTEQLASRLLPLLPLRELAKAFGFAAPADAETIAASTIREIAARQRGDGGFGMWPESDRSFAWVSGYATWALDQAAHAGASVPPKALERAHAYLREVLANHYHQNPIDWATAAFLVDVLAEAGISDPGYESRLFDDRNQLPLFARAFLAHALALTKGMEAQSKAVGGEIASALRIDGNSAFVAENTGDDYALVFDSTARTGALVLRALLAADAGHPLIAPLARGLLSQRHQGRFRTTQETAYALLALDAYRRVHETNAPQFSATVWLGKSTLGKKSFQGQASGAQTLKVPFEQLASRGEQVLGFEKKGNGTLYYEARLKYVRQTLPATALDLGFTVQKTLRAVSPASLAQALKTVPAQGVSRIPPGSLVIADIVLVTPSPRDYVVIDDPLPLGLEAIDAQLATTAAWLNVDDSSGEADPACPDCERNRDAIAAGGAFFSSDFRKELRDDRVLFFIDHLPAGMFHYRYLARATALGSFIMPPTRAEEMYTPETFGRTEARLIEVR
jgi:alpha-2-macroglobulin